MICSLRHLELTFQPVYDHFANIVSTHSSKGMHPTQEHQQPTEIPPATKKW